MLCFVPVLRVFGMFAAVSGIILFPSVLAITEKRDLDLYEVPLSMSCWVLGWRLC